MFTAGVLLSFWGLAGLLAALRAGGDQLGWGFQLQSPGFVFALALIMLAFALNLSGVYEFGTSATGVGSGLTMKSGLVGTFFTGFLATCSGDAVQRAFSGAGTRRCARAANRVILLGVHFHRDRAVASLFAAVDLPLRGEAVAPGPGAGWRRSSR